MTTNLFSVDRDGIVDIFQTINDVIQPPTTRANNEPTPSADNAFSDAVGSDTVGTGAIREGAIPSVRVVSIPDATTITPDVNQADTFFHRNTQAAGTLTVAKPLGNPKEGQKFILKILSTNAQTFSWHSVFRGSASLSLPTATSGSGDYDYIGFVYNSVDSSWDLLAVIQGT